MGQDALAMATEIRLYDPVIPAGTPIAAPVTVDVSFEAMVTELIEWSVPKGAMGLMGWRLVDSSGQIVPKTPGAWIIAHGESGSWRLDQLHTSGKWQVLGYNTGAFAHVVHLRFHVSPIGGKDSASGPLAWLAAGRVTSGLVAVGGMANAPAAVDIPRHLLWPPPGR